MTQTNTTQNKEELEELKQDWKEKFETNLKELDSIGKWNIPYATIIDEVEAIVNRAILQAHQSGIEEGAEEERERIRLAFVKECEINNKLYGGSFVDYSFENKVIENKQ